MPSREDERHRRINERLERERLARRQNRKATGLVGLLFGGGALFVIVLNLAILAASVAIIVALLKAFGVL